MLPTRGEKEFEVRVDVGDHVQMVAFEFVERIVVEFHFGVDEFDRVVEPPTCNENLAGARRTMDRERCFCGLTNSFLSLGR